jgi:hypothetical protein
MNANGAVPDAPPKWIVGRALTVWNGAGLFLERVHDNAPAHELRKAAPVVARQRGVTVAWARVKVPEHSCSLFDVGSNDAPIRQLLFLRSAETGTGVHVPRAARSDQHVTIRIIRRVVGLLQLGTSR